MPDLIGLKRSALFNADRTARFDLRVIWDPSRPLLGWLMANPSEAGEQTNDMTFLRVWKFSERDAHYGGFIIANVVPFVSSNPDVCLKRVDAAYLFQNDDKALIEENSRHLVRVADQVADWCLAYGAVGHRFGQHANWAIDDLISGGAVRFMVLDTSRSGIPMHPMARGLHRIPDDREFRAYEPRSKAVGDRITLSRN